ncbi:S-layer homology domain-containing protein [Paenibacillus sp. YIM B09110]|uniref:S-layer homology domain-containing protein n=1 Tax=Paenibacillus sp. YIM B09110 TaxID=3126102 RepID=UPI00301D9D65
MFNRRWLVLLLVVVVFTSSATLYGGDSKVYAAFSGAGDGSPGNPYIIASIEQLKEVSDDMDAAYRLGADLDLSGENWEPIGSWGSEPFTGLFDGDGHTIANLTIDTDGAGTNNLGLFGYASNAEFRNIGLVNVFIDSYTGDYIGGVIGYSQNSLIEYVYVTGTIIGDESVGGLTGYASGNPGDDIRYAYSSTHVTGSNNVGGLNGMIEGYLAVENSYYNSTLTSSSAGGEPLTEVNMKLSDSFTDWYFANEDGDGSEWGIIDGLTYPMLRKTFDRITLDALKVTAGTDPDNGDPVELGPSFAKDQVFYSGIVPNEVDQVTVHVDAQDSESSINNGAALETIDLDEGENLIDIKVSSAGAAVPSSCIQPCTLPDPYVLTYTLQINREDGNAFPHTISTAEQLAAIGTGVADGYQLNDDYILMNDIDLSEYLSDSGGGYNEAKGWVPIGDAAKPFTGTFDGNGHVINNLIIDRIDEEDIGFFGVASGTIQEIGMTNMEIAGKRTVGGIVGSLLDDGIISNAYSTGTVTATVQRAGGLVGKLQGELNETFSTADAIGLSGSDYIGGLVGESAHAIVTDSFAAGRVTSAASTGVGGLIGASIDTAVTDSFWDIETSEQPTSAGGSGAIGKLSTEMKSKSTYSAAGVDWDFTNTWAMISGTTYPMFEHELEPAKLASLSVSATGAVLTRSPADFDSELGLYTITSNRYIDSVDITVALANLNAKVSISGTEASSATVSVNPGDNEITIETEDENGKAHGIYKLNVQIPAPEINDVNFPAGGYYGTGDTLKFVISYEGSVDAPVGTPRLPIVIGEGADTSTVYALYTEQPAGERNKLVFAYEVQDGLLDTDGIEIGTEIDLPVGAALTASGVDVPLDVPATGANGIVIDSVKPSITWTQTPDSTTPTKGSVKVTVATDGTGSDIAVTKWTKGVRTVDFFASAGTLLTGDSFDITSNGAYTVYTEDQAGNGAVEIIAISNFITVTPDGSTSNDSHLIDLNGQPLDSSTIDASKPSVTLEVKPKEGAAFVTIPAKVLASWKSKNEAFVIEIKSPYGSYQVPVNLASLIPGLPELLADSNLKVDEISFKITLTDKSNNKEILTAFAKGLPNGIELGAIVDFRIDIINPKTGQTIGTADKFSQALTRIIPMPKNVTIMPLLWGAFRYNEALKEFEFVPARRVQIEGLWYISINSHTNSVYVVAENAANFTDVLKHWGKSFIEQAAAKGLVEGIGGGNFAPDKAVTRAEFTAMLVRALGRGTAASSTAPYEDVNQSAWYFGEVAIAKELGLLDFVESSSFNPDQPLSREEMASMLAAVIELEKLPTTKEFVRLDGYKDIGNVNSAYLEDVRLMVKLNIMTGMSEVTFNPKGELTRAQAAVVFIRLLQTLGSIE